MQRFAFIVVGLGIVSVASFASAQSTAGQASAIPLAEASKQRTVTGPIIMVFKQGKKIELRTPDNHMVDATVTDKTRNTVDGKEAKYEDLNVKQTATVVVENDKAVSIDAKSPEPKK